MDISE